MKTPGFRAQLRGFGISGVIALTVGAAPFAHARSLQDIYQDMLTANKQQSCSHGVPASGACLDSTITKQRLVAEVAPLLQAMPAPPQSPVENAQGQLHGLQKQTAEWTAGHCNGFPDTAHKMTTCTGADTQEWFDALTQNVGQVVRGT